MWFRQQAALFPDLATLMRGLAADEAELRRRFWRMLKREAASLPFAEQLLTAYYCAFDRRTPLYVKAMLIGAIVYFVVPDRFMTKAIPLIAAADDAAILAVVFKAVSSHIKLEHREAAQRTLIRLRG
jgi:uncharacterized membrane protein YkvA (DUF1232 family)